MFLVVMHDMINDEEEAIVAKVTVIGR